MTLRETLDSDYRAALKLQAPAKGVLTAIRSEIQNAQIAARTNGMLKAGDDVPDTLVITTLRKMKKQRHESSAEYLKGKRQDLADQEEFEAEVIAQYLPASMSADELKKLVSEIILETGATTLKDLGRVVGKAVQKSAGLADGKAIQDLAKTLLA